MSFIYNLWATQHDYKVRDEAGTLLDRWKLKISVNGEWLQKG